MNQDDSNTHAKRAQLELEPHEFLAELVAYAMQAHDRTFPVPELAGPAEREAFARRRSDFRSHVHERLAQVVQVYVLEAREREYVDHAVGMPVPFPKCARTAREHLARCLDAPCLACVRARRLLGGAT